jgi:hypothetical protein
MNRKQSDMDDTDSESDNDAPSVSSNAGSDPSDIIDKHGPTNPVTSLLDPPVDEEAWQAIPEQY